MYCMICGDENSVKYRGGNRGMLCDSCAADTPAKVDRARFDAEYWGAEASNVPESTKREFYSDYRASSNTLADYITTTTTEG